MGGQIECQICGEEFKSIPGLQQHQHRTYNKESHGVAVSEWKTGQPCVWCGGEVRTVGVGAEGWETSCIVCDYLYDED